MALLVLSSIAVAVFFLQLFFQSEFVPRDVDRATKSANCVWYSEFKSIVAVERKWYTLHPGEKAPDDKSLNRWMKKFKETGSVAKGASPGQPRTSENVEHIRQSCVRSPKRSIARRSLAFRKLPFKTSFISIYDFMLTRFSLGMRLSLRTNLSELNLLLL
ncbi:hypothetical protein AVEN_223226-1 [Araneus ventricosus]|uniref:DUF4817 domain-containing protein n=1 Tax=Araneus ventricosus TaxID=182803 RepID=A0A4Y2JF25_ARAVE|nr:hypothetical protein AVEN_223226-1 [Araneus ventricosus]